MIALQNAATGTSILAEMALVGASVHEIGRRLFAAITGRRQDVFDNYRPELHYMGGPGPRWREKHGIVSSTRQIHRPTYPRVVRIGGIKSDDRAIIIYDGAARARRTVKQNSASTWKTFLDPLQAISARMPPIRAFYDSLRRCRASRRPYCPVRWYSSLARRSAADRPADPS
jgi:hypothetical protein